MMVKLKAIPPIEVAQQSEAITSHVLAHPAFKQSKSVFCYLNMPGGEVQTDKLVHAILDSGKALWVPRINKGDEVGCAAESHGHQAELQHKKGSHMDALRIHSLEDYQSLIPGLWGIREPPKEYDGKPRLNVQDAESGGIDLVLMPGVAFDASFSRLGHGKGYYDRFLSHFAALAPVRGWSMPTLLALGFDQQLLPAGGVPVHEYDWPMDGVITSDGVLDRSKTDSESL